MIHNILCIQLILSFFIGGFIVALQAFIAERSPKQIAGIIVSLPSTIIVNLFFLGLVLSPKEFDQLLPLLPAPLGFSFIFICAYISAADWLSHNSKISKLAMITVLSLISLAIWLVPSVWLVLNKFDNLTISLLVYLFCIISAQIFLNRKSQTLKTSSEILTYTFSQKLFRAIFAGSMIAVTIYLGKTLGPFWGAVMTMFPAAYLSAIIIIHYYYDHNKLIEVFSSSALGSTSLILYAFVAHYSFPLLGVYWGTLTSILVSMSYSLILSKIHNRDRA